MAREELCIRLRKENLKRETESFRIEVKKKNALRTNYVKAKIDNTQQNRKFKLCKKREETINHFVSECSKLAQKEYKTKHDWMGKIIQW